MSEPLPTLADAFVEAQWKLGGHSPRNVQVLKDVFSGVPGETESDMYGKGKVMEQFESKMAEVLGKESAVFFPSGTMAQQIGLRIWCDEQGLKQVAYHPLCHLEIHEQDGLKELHGIKPVLLADKDRLITLEDVKTLNGADTACLLLELPQREIGGQLPDFAELEAIAAYCREQGIRLHLDGARLLEVLPFYQKTAAEVCGLFDSVYISFYKGIGGVAGAILAGPQAFTEQSKVWKRRHGGDLISLYPYVISSDYYYELRQGKMGQYYEDAKELAALYNDCSNTYTRPAVPVSNMFHVHFELPKTVIEPLLADVTRETGIGFNSYVREDGETHSSYEVSLGDRYRTVPKEKLRKAFSVLNEKLEIAGAAGQGR